MTTNSDVCKTSTEEELLAVEYEIEDIDAAIKSLNEKKNVLLRRRQILSNKQNRQSIAEKNWDEERFPWSKNLASTLQQTFKISNFRPLQLSAMNATLSKVDVLLIMSAGGGKSLCYQLPAVISNGVAVVVSPLIALMEDQVIAMKKLNVAAEMISNASSNKHINRIFSAMGNKEARLKLLYVTPERLAKSKLFMSQLKKTFRKKRLSLFAIDEVHCCSQWGHDFRRNYKFLGVLKRMFPGVPILGLTATATSMVIVDLQKMLNIQGCLVLKATFNRPNLYYEVRIKPSRQADCISQLEDLLKRKYTHQCGIIYCNYIMECEKIVKGLRERGITLGVYHANLDPELRSQVHLNWLRGNYQVVVATIAFGLGINKPDVRFVIHHCLPHSINYLYQESGRAGRDNKPADCILFYRLSDVFKLSSRIFSEKAGLENLYGILAYCLNSNKCRRSIIASHFGEVWESSDCNAMCDHCRKPCESKEVDIGNYCRSLYKIMLNAAGVNVKLTAQMLIDAWLGKGQLYLRVDTIPVPDLDPEMCENIVGHLLVEGYFREDFHLTPNFTKSYITKGPRAGMVCNGEHKIIMEIKGNSLPLSVVTNTKDSEETLGNQGAERDDEKSDIINIFSIEESDKPDKTLQLVSDIAESGGYYSTQYNVKTEPNDSKPIQSGTECVSDCPAAPNPDCNSQYIVKKEPGDNKTSQICSVCNLVPYLDYSSEYNVKKAPDNSKPSQIGTEPCSDCTLVPNIDDSSEYNVKKECMKRTIEEINLCSDSNDEEPALSNTKRKYILIESDSSDDFL